MSREQLNLRLDSELKAKFSELCDRNRATMSEAIIEYISQCVEADQLLTDSFLASSSNVQTTDQSDLIERVVALEKKSSVFHPNPSRLTPMITR